MCMINGRAVTAISPKPQENPFPNVWSTYLASDDLDATAARAKAAGSTFMMEPMDVMTAGRLGFAMDPTGAPYGIWQAGDHKGVAVYNEPADTPFGRMALIVGAQGEAFSLIQAPRQSEE
jgi:predicted enzyme related to lactoylglutathione lyase